MKTWNIYILLALLLMGACTDEEDVNPPGPIGKDPDKTTLTLKFPKSAVDTKAFTASEENHVGSLDILVFTQATGTGVTLLDDSFAYSIKVPASAITSSTTTIDGDTKTAEIKVKNMDKAQRFILLANLPSNTLNSTDTVENKKLGAIIDKLTYNGSSWMEDRLTSARAGFPMWGQMAIPVLFHHTNSSIPDEVEVNMIRAVARIDVGFDIYGNGDPALGFGSITDLDSVYLCNANTKGYIVPHTNYLATADSAAKDKVYLTNIPTNLPADKKQIGYKFNGFENNTMVRTIYAPESDTLKTSPANTPAFLVVKAKYYDTPTYYRIDFTDNGKYIPLLRNHRYTVNILGARAKGFDTLQEALDSHPSSSNPALIFDVEELELKEVASNDQYYLAYAANEIKVDWNGRIRIPVMTDYPGGWTATATGDYSFTDQGNGGSLDHIEYTLPKITSGGSKEINITLKAGTLTRNIKVTQIIGSNSYVVASNGVLEIPINSANLAGDLLTSVTNLKAKIAWSSTNSGTSPSLIGNGSTVGKTGIITVDAASPGNMVICLTTEGGPGMVGGVSGESIIWSWHVWVTESGYDPIATQRSNNTYLIMNRNLGATGPTANGLYYQWGRKDPFDGTQSPTEILGVSVSNNLPGAIKNPSAFYTVSSSPYDWIGSSQNNNLWATAGGEKGSYDPCPFGWRVPAYNSEAESPWLGISGTSGNGLSFPTPGGLSMTTGLLVSGGGYLWGASARGTAASVFNYTSTPTHTQAYRANGYQVRCVRDIK